MAPRGFRTKTSGLDWPLHVKQREDDNYEPYVLLKKYWEEEVRKAGSVEKAGALRWFAKTTCGAWALRDAQCLGPAPLTTCWTGPWFFRLP